MRRTPWTPIFKSKKQAGAIQVGNTPGNIQVSTVAGVTSVPTVAVSAGSTVTLTDGVDAVGAVPAVTVTVPGLEVIDYWAVTGAEADRVIEVGDIIVMAHNKTDSLTSHDIGLSPGSTSGAWTVLYDSYQQWDTVANPYGTTRIKIVEVTAAGEITMSPNSLGAMCGALIRGPRTRINQWTVDTNGSGGTSPSYTFDNTADGPNVVLLVASGTTGTGEGFTPSSSHSVEVSNQRVVSGYTSSAFALSGDQLQTFSGSFDQSWMTTNGGYLVFPFDFGTNTFDVDIVGHGGGTQQATVSNLADHGNGDIMVMVACYFAGSQAGVPSGWSRVSSQQIGSLGWHEVFTRVKQSGDTSVTLSYAGGNGGAASVYGASGKTSVAIGTVNTTTSSSITSATGSGVDTLWVTTQVANGNNDQTPWPSRRHEIASNSRTIGVDTRVIAHIDGNGENRAHTAPVAGGTYGAAVFPITFS